LERQFEPSKQRVLKSGRRDLIWTNISKSEQSIQAQDPALLTSDPDARCVKGCYRCLLSYYNQPDHELIDRTDRETLELLLHLAASSVNPAAPNGSSDSNLVQWLRAFESWRIPKPSTEALTVDEVAVPLVWREHRVLPPASA